MAFSFKNSKGKEYFLHVKKVKRASGKETELYYFSTDLRKGHQGRCYAQQHGPYPPHSATGEGAPNKRHPDQHTALVRGAVPQTPLLQLQGRAQQNAQQQGRAKPGTSMGKSGAIRHASMLGKRLVPRLDPTVQSLAVPRSFLKLCSRLCNIDVSTREGTPSRLPPLTQPSLTGLPT